MASGPKIAEQAKTQLTQLTGLKPETVSSLSKNPEGWHVSVDMLEMKRIPEASDVLATYEVLLDEDGNVLSFERTRRYYRGEADE
jgi:hypothetical protein